MKRKERKSEVSFQPSVPHGWKVALVQKSDITGSTGLKQGQSLQRNFGHSLGRHTANAVRIASKRKEEMSREKAA